MIKALMLVGALAFGMTAKLGAYSWGDFARDSRSHFTLLDNVSPAYFKDLETGRNAGGVITSVFTLGNGAFSGDFGWVNTIDHGDDVGSPGIGGGVHAEKLIALIFPEFSAQIRSWIPKSAQPFTDKITLGYFLAQNLGPDVKDQLSHYAYSGLELRFK